MMETMINNIVPISILFALIVVSMVLEVLFRKKDKLLLSRVFAILTLLLPTALFVLLLAIDAEASVILPLFLLAILVALML